MYSQFRVDLTDKQRIKDVLEALLKSNKVISYLISPEISEIVKKEHYQGWVHHNMKDTAYRVYFGKHFNDLGPKQKCFTKIKDTEVYMSYIIKNANKTVDHSNLITNISEAEYQATHNRLVEFKAREVYARVKQDTRSFTDRVYDALLTGAVRDGLIQYRNIYPIYMAHKPKQIDAILLERNLNGLTNRLEQEFKHPSNDLVFTKLKEGLIGKNGSIYF